MNRVIDCEVGIYRAEYTLIAHRNGTYSVKTPYIRWSRDSGVLAHAKIPVRPEDAGDVLKFFEAGELVLDADNMCGMLSLDDVLDGYRHPDVHVSA